MQATDRLELKAEAPESQTWVMAVSPIEVYPSGGPFVPSDAMHAVAPTATIPIQRHATATIPNGHATTMITNVMQPPSYPTSCNRHHTQRHALSLTLIAALMLTPAARAKGCTNCCAVCPTTFALEDDFGRARVMNQRVDGNEKLQEAIDTCPVSCIHWVS